MTVIEHIQQLNHDLIARFEHLREQIEASRKKRSLFKELVCLVEAHHKAEEKIFYKALLQKENARLNAYLCFEEHNILEQLLKELRDLPLTEEEWEAKFLLFAQIACRHLKGTEDETFQLAEKIFTKEELNKMGDFYLTERKNYENNPQNGKD